MVEYRNRKGELIRIETLSWALNPDEAKEVGLSKDRKSQTYYRNGRFESEVRKEIGHSFSIMNYPHILDYPYGISNRDERLYTIRVGEMTEFSNEGDFMILLKAYHFLDEVNQKGEIIQENPYRAKKGEQIDLTKYPTSFVEVSTDAAPRATNRDQRATELLENDEIEDK